MTFNGRRLVSFCLVLLITLPAGLQPASATCGGGGGGGMGGATSSGGTPMVYRVPWKVVGRGAAPPDGLLVVYWFPVSPETVKGSDLLTSRYLALSSAPCVGMALVTNDNAELRGKYGAPASEPIAVLASKDGTEIARAKADGGKVKVDAVEALLKKEMDRREDEAKAMLDAAGKKADQKDAAGAEALYMQVWEQRCLLPGPAKKAAKALKKLGKPVPEAESSRLETEGPTLSEPFNTRIVQTMKAGLRAEWDGRILEAKRLYSEARKLDPADPVPACFLGELLRHHTGEWSEARAIFDRILGMRADPVSRAVALHGLGKMTIHDGAFDKGLALFEESLRAYPLALTYRNLAVYWNSEANRDRAYEYVKKAVALDPDDEYTQIFAATYLAEMGHRQEAEEVARRHEKVLAASYNLAVIYAHAGNKNKTLELLRRHFFVYEQFDAVRRKEMQEARDDIAFDRYRQDPDFVKLTALADKDDTSYHRKSG
jgi:tetratricopeptide (TPR) repeat protein